MFRVRGKVARQKFDRDVAVETARPKPATLRVGSRSLEFSAELPGSTIGQVSGTASRTSIRITTWGPQAREDDGPRVRAVVNAIDLMR